jgi:predicted DNA-binding transcriptional regulator AlpA
MRLTGAVDQPTTTEDIPKLLIGIGSLSRMLDMSTRTIRRKHSAGQIPRPLRISGAVRWSVDEVRAWVRRGCPDRATWEAMGKPS